MPNDLLLTSTVKCFSFEIVHTALVVRAQGKAKEFYTLKSVGEKTKCLTCSYYVKCNEIDVSSLCTEVFMQKSTRVMLCIENRKSV